ncbi:hypothetical protein KY289_001238 [Solanum tuberosum]|nr:hypothetical protein KY289_001238 [Solanum tuberosum]
MESQLKSCRKVLKAFIFICPIHHCCIFHNSMLCWRSITKVFMKTWIHHFAWLNHHQIFKTKTQTNL